MLSDDVVTAWSYSRITLSERYNTVLTSERFRDNRRNVQLQETLAVEHVKQFDDGTSLDSQKDARADRRHALNAAARVAVDLENALKAPVNDRKPLEPIEPLSAACLRLVQRSDCAKRTTADLSPRAWR